METLECLIRRVVREELALRTPEERLLYSVTDAARMLSMSKVWLYERINAGDVAVVELGSSRPKQRIAASELQRFIASRTFGMTH